MASYRPLSAEAAPLPIERLVKAADGHVAYPRIDTDGLMRFYIPSHRGGFARNLLGFDEPADDARPARPTIVLLPLLAFDRSGTRLGQGGGHYDRALAVCAAAEEANGRSVVKIGIAWSAQEMADLPREAWDIPLDIVITEREWIVTS